MIVDLGETWSSPTYEVKDTAGAYADAGAGAVTASIALPDATTVPGVVSHPGTGKYTVDYPTALEGLHEITVTATGGVLGALIRSWRESFTVERARLLVGVDDVIEHLRGAGVLVDPSDREHLRWLCQVATDDVERDLSRVLVRRTVTETFDGGSERLRLRRVPPRPVDGGSITIGSVTENGTTLSPAAGYFLTADYELGRGSRLAPTSWFTGTENVTVTYTSSCNPVPVVARLAALNAAADLWLATQQAPLDAYAEASADGPGPGGMARPPGAQSRGYRSLRRRRLIA